MRNNNRAVRVLLVDDDPTIRVLLKLFFKHETFEISEASSGLEAWDLLQRELIDIAIIDWEMPEMDGVQLCRKIRDSQSDHYVYILMCTGRDSKNDWFEGMTAGADDFLVKPIRREELMVRMSGAQRIHELQTALAERNVRLEEEKEKLRVSQEQILDDLQAASQVVQSLLPTWAKTRRDFDVAACFQPSLFLGGDFYDFFELGPDLVGFYVLDVAGHGVKSALFAVTLYHELSPTQAGSSLLDSSGEVRSVERVLEHLNEKYQGHCDTYFTMLYLLFDLKSGCFHFCQGGHPPPLLLSPGQPAQALGDGGFPVGLFEQAEFVRKSQPLEAGQRVLLYSDGVTECTNASGEQFGEERLIAVLENSRNLDVDDTLLSLKSALLNWTGGEPMEDDCTAIFLDYRGC